MAGGGLFEGWSRDGLKSSVSQVVSQMGYSIDASESHDDGFSFTAFRQEPLGKVKVLVYVFVLDKEVSKHKVSEVLKISKEKDVSHIVLFSPSGYSDTALKFSGNHGIAFYDGKALEDLMQKHLASAPQKEKIFELAFDLGETLSQAAGFFDRECGKKFLGFGVEERIVEVHGRYAPVCSFMLSRDEEVKTGLSGTVKNVRKSNFFYVNLNTNEFYYISRGLGKDVKLVSSDILNRLMFLTLGSVEMLADIMKKGEIPVGELHDRHELFYEENMNDLQLLWEQGLIASTTDKKGVMANLTIPAFDNPRYDLRGFTSVVKSVSSDFDVDAIKFDRKDVVKLLELFYAGKGEVKEVIYLPYYTCKYADDKGMSRSKVLLAPKYLTSV